MRPTARRPCRKLGGAAPCQKLTKAGGNVIGVANTKENVATT